MMSNQGRTRWDNICGLGSTLCLRLQRIYFVDEPWISYYMKVVDKFNELKTCAKRFYPHMDELKILETLQSYTDIELMEIIQHGHEQNFI